MLSGNRKIIHLHKRNKKIVSKFIEIKLSTIMKCLLNENSICLEGYTNSGAYIINGYESHKSKFDDVN